MQDCPGRVFKNGLAGRGAATSQAQASEVAVRAATRSPHTAILIEFLESAFYGQHMQRVASSPLPNARCMGRLSCPFRQTSQPIPVGNEERFVVPL